MEGLVMTNNRYDVVIVGGGFAGVTAARELSRDGKSVLILEARDRLGGRTHYEEVPQLDRSVEMGGTWVHWFQPHLWSELNRYGIDLIESIGAAAPEQVIYRTDGERKLAEIDDAWPILESAITKFFAGHAQTALPRPFDPLFAAEKIKEVDGYSCQDRIDVLGVSDEQKDLLNAMWSLCCGGAASDGGFVTMLRWYALSGYTPSGIFDTCTRFKINGGTKRLLEEINADSNAEIRLNAPVSAVTTTDDGTTIVLRDGERIHCSAVIVTVPLNVLADIEFTPPLSEGKRNAANRKQASKGLKLWVRVKGDLPRPLFAMAPDDEVFHYAHTEDIYDDGQLLVVFGPDPEKLADVDSPEDVQPHMRRLLGESIDVVATSGKNWHDDEFAKGAWSVYRPGQLTESLAALQESTPPVFLAGGDIASGWNGFIDGAIESAHTIARQVNEYLP